MKKVMFSFLVGCCFLLGSHWAQAAALNEVCTSLDTNLNGRIKMNVSVGGVQQKSEEFAVQREGQGVFKIMGDDGETLTGRLENAVYEGKSTCQIMVDNNELLKEGLILTKINLSRGLFTFFTHVSVDTESYGAEIQIEKL